MVNKDNAGSFGMGLLVGAVAGLVVGLLFAPKSGRETRAMLKERAENMKERAEEMKEKAAGLAERMKEKATEIRGRATEKLAG